MRSEAGEKQEAMLSQTWPSKLKEDMISRFLGDSARPNTASGLNCVTFKKIYNCKKHNKIYHGNHFKEYSLVMFSKTFTPWTMKIVSSFH